MHQASDSSSYVTKANKILEQIEQGTKPRRHITLQPDGDLWQQFEKAARSKGPKSIKIRWTKGHAKAEHIAKGISNEKDKQGNDLADMYADLGITRCHEEGILDVAEYANHQREAQRELCIIIQKATLTDG